MESVGMEKSWNKPYDRDDPAAQTTDASSEGGRIVSVSLTARSEYWAWDISQSGTEDTHKMKEEPHSSSGLFHCQQLSVVNIVSQGPKGPYFHV